MSTVRVNIRQDPQKNLAGQRNFWHSLMERPFRQFDLTPQIAWEGGWSFVLKISNAGLSFLAALLLARFLGPTGYGIYAYVYALVALLAIPANLGLPILIVRETAQGMAQDRPEWVRGIWLWSMRTVGKLSFTLVLLAAPAFILWHGGLKDPKGVTLAIALTLLPLIALGNLISAALQGLKQIVSGQLPELLIRPLLFVLLLIGAELVLAGRNFSAPLAMALYVMAALIAFIAGGWILWRSTPPSVRQAQPLFKGRAWFISSLMFALVTGFSVINNQASVILLGLFKSSDQVGIFRIATQVAAFASIGLDIINTVAAPRFANLYAVGDTVRLQHIVTLSARVITGLNLLLTIFFLFLGKPFLRLFFGADFVLSYSPLVILLIGQLVNSAVGSVGYLLNMTGKERETARGMIIATGCNVILNLVLIPWWGTQGAAVASMISMIVWNVLLWVAVRKQLGINSLAFASSKRTI